MTQDDNDTSSSNISVPSPNFFSMVADAAVFMIALGIISGVMCSSASSESVLGSVLGDF